MSTEAARNRESTFALEAWDRAISQGQNHLMRFASSKLACDVAVDWDQANPNEPKVINFRFEDDSTLLVVEDSKGIYRFLKIIEPDNRIVDAEATDRFLVKVEKYRTKGWISRNRTVLGISGLIFYFVVGGLLIFSQHLSVTKSTRYINDRL